MNKDTGGHVNNSEFLFNPVYQLVVEGNPGEQIIFFAELSFNSKDIPCSLYLYNTPK